MAQDPKGLVYQGKEGTGAAVLTTQHDTLDASGMHWKQLQKKQAQEQAERDLKQKTISDIDKLAGSGWYPHREFINNQVDELREHVTNAYMKGADPMKGEYGAKTSELKRNITESVETSEYLKDYYTDLRKQYDKNPDKWEAESFVNLQDSFYDLPGVMTGEKTLGHLKPKKEQMKWYDRYSKIKPTYKDITIEKGDVTTSSKSFNDKNAIARAQDEFLQMDDLTDIVRRYPDSPPNYSKEDAKWQPYIETGYEAYKKAAEMVGVDKVITKNQYENAIYDAYQFSKSSANTEYKRTEDEPKQEYGWGGKGYKSKDFEAFRGGTREYEITTGSGKRVESVALDEYSLGGKKADKPIKVDATQFIDMSTGDFMKDENNKPLVGDQNVSITNLLMVAVKNGKIQATDNPDKIREMVQNDPEVYIDWYAEGTRYSTEKKKPEGKYSKLLDKKTKSEKVENKVMIPYDNIKSKLSASYDGFDLEERELNEYKDIELYSIFKRENPNASKEELYGMVWDAKNQE